MCQAWLCVVHTTTRTTQKTKMKQKRKKNNIYICIYIETVEINLEVLSIPTKGPQSLVREENGTKTINESMLYCPMYK